MASKPILGGMPRVSSEDVFDDYKKDWWNPKGRLRSLHKITPLRFGYFKDIAENLNGLEGKKIVDVGCGGGLLSECFAREGGKVTAIDLAPTAIEAAREHAEAEGLLEIDYRNISVEKLLEEEGARGTFDVVVCSEVLEHVDDLPDFVANLSRLLKPGGTLFFSTINKTLKARFFMLFVAEDLLGFVEQGTHDYKRFIKPSRLMGLLKENSVVLKDVKGISFDILKRSFKVSSDVSVNYIGYAVKR